MEHYIACLSEIGVEFGLREGFHKYTTEGPAKLKFHTDVGVDVVVCNHDPSLSGELVEDNNPKLFFGVISWPGLELAKKTNVFGLEFFVPDNFKDLLFSKYGETWVHPQGEQWGEK